jgi:MFS family permease
MPNKTLRVLFACNAIFVFAGNLLGPLYAVFVQGINHDIPTISGSWAVYLVSASMSMFLFTRVRDRGMHKKRLLIGAYLVRALVWFLYSLVNNLGFLLILQVILGFGEAMGTPAFDAIFAEHLDGGQHIADYSEWQLVSNLVLAVGTFVGGLIVANFGFQPLFLVMSFLGILSAISTYIKLDDC